MKTEEQKLQEIESLFPKVEQGYPYTKITVKRILDWHNAQQPAMTEEQMEQEAREITIPNNVDPKLIEDLAQQISRSCPSQDFKLIKPSDEIVAATIVKHKGKGKALKMWCRISFQTMGLVTID
jgi:hypothetical protein